MNLLSIFSKKSTEPTSVAEALAGTMNSSSKSKNRKSEKNSSDDEQLIPEKKRARRRLIGAIVMVLAVVIGLPMVLDSEPKVINKNIAIQISSGNESTVATEPKENVTEEVADSDPMKQEVASPSTPPAAETSKPIANEDAQVSTPLSKPTVATKPATKSETKSETKPAINDGSTVDESARALAILNGSGDDSGSAPTKSATRIVVQIGAFATEQKVNELRNKLTSAGIKSYTQKVATRSGDKIRVRIGPFEDKESADKVKVQLEKLDLNGTLITLQ